MLGCAFPRVWRSLHCLRGISVRSITGPVVGKEFEDKDDLERVDPARPFYIRLDGSRFGQLVKRSPKFKLPWDERVHNAIVLTARDLLYEYHPSCVYTCSDEITLSFIPPPEKATYPFGGRIQKMLSCCAAYTSVKFNYHLKNQNYDSDPELKDRVDNSLQAYFDSRLYIVNNYRQLFDNIRWRQLDCIRNSKSILGYTYLPKNHIKNMPANIVVKEVINSAGVDWKEQPQWYKYGMVLKKQYYWKETENPKTGDNVLAKRKKAVDATILLDQPFEETSDNLFSHVLEAEFAELQEIEENYQYSNILRANGESLAPK